MEPLLLAGGRKLRPWPHPLLIAHVGVAMAIAPASSEAMTPVQLTGAALVLPGVAPVTFRPAR